MASDSDDLRMQARGGGSLLLAWQLQDKRVLIVGGGEVASQRIESILVADGYITLLCPEKGLHPRTRRFIEERADRITYYDRRFTGPAELHKMDLVLTAIDDVNRSREICELCRKAKIPVNVADIPDSCDFYFGSQILDLPLQVMVSTNGNGPRMASLIKTRLENALSGTEGKALKKVGVLRAQLKKRAPGTGGPVGRKRMKWMSTLCNSWEMEDFSLLDDAMIKRLLDEGWEKNHVPTFEDVGGKHPPGAKVPQARGTQMTTSLLLPSAIGFIAGALCTTWMFVSWRR